MTVASNGNKHIYVGNGVSRVWPYTFLLLDPAHLKVYVRRGEAEPALLTSGYVLNEQSGTVTYPPAGTGQEPLAAEDRITLLREVPEVQELNLKNGGTFLAEDIENNFDKLVMMIQQLSERLGRAVLASVDGTSVQAYEALVEAVSQAIAARDEARAIVAGFDAHAALKAAEYLAAFDAKITEAQAWAEQSCCCAEAARKWYSKISDTFTPNFFNTFFILAGINDGKDGALELTDVDDGGSASTFLYMSEASDGAYSATADWYIVNPAIADALRGRSVISGRLQENGELVLITD